VRRWVPEAYANRPVYIFETGGSTGVPKSRINIEDFRIDYEMFSETLSDDSFPKGSDWLMLGPSGPRRLRLAVEHLCQHRGGICFLVDLDPRWVVKLISKGRMDVMIEYRDHVISQGLTLLRAHENIRCLFTTPKLLEALCERVSLARLGIKGVFCGGTQLTAQFHRFAREELLEGKVELVPTYGNTLMGLACHKPFDPADNYSVIYHPPCPRAMIEVVNPDEPRKVVEYGQLGRVRLTTPSAGVFRNCLIILMSDSRETISAIAGHWRCSPETVKRIRTLYRMGGVEGLYPIKPPARSFRGGLHAAILATGRMCPQSTRYSCHATPRHPGRHQTR